MYRVKLSNIIYGILDMYYTIMHYTYTIYNIGMTIFDKIYPIIKRKKNKFEFNKKKFI